MSIKNSRFISNIFIPGDQYVNSSDQYLRSYIPSGHCSGRCVNVVIAGINGIISVLVRNLLLVGNKACSDYFEFQRASVIHTKIYDRGGTLASFY